MTLSSCSGASVNIKVALGHLKVFSQDTSVDDFLPKFPLAFVQPQKNEK